MTKINHDIRSNDGQTIYLPPEIGGASGPSNLALPNVYETTTAMKYPIGTRFVNGGRTYHYGKHGTAVTYTCSGLANHGNFYLAYSNSDDTATASGSTTIRMDGTSDGVPAVNALAGGYLFLWVSASLGYTQMRVVSSTVADATSPYYVTLTLEQPLPVDVGANTGLEVYANQYADMRTAWLSAQPVPYMAIVGMPTVITDADTYGWVQTWGPIFIVNSGTQTGAASFDRMLVWDSDGSVTMADEAYYGQLSKQIAGYALNFSSSGSADQWMMLTLDP